VLTSADGALAEAIVFWKPLWRQTVGSMHPGEYEVDYLAPLAVTIAGKLSLATSVLLRGIAAIIEAALTS
jgi:hypothetical protein